MGKGALAGLRLLIVEDEFLIAMDIEHACLQNGAARAVIVGSVEELGADPFGKVDFDAAIIDVMVGGGPSLDFARELRTRGIPFVFATGYSDREDIFAEFMGVEVIAKPYLASDLIAAIASAVDAARNSRGV